MAEHHTVAVRVVGSKPIIRPKKTWYVKSGSFCFNMIYQLCYRGFYYRRTHETAFG